MDFRTLAAENTFRLTQNSSGSALAELGKSGCVKVPGGRRLHRLVEIPFLAVSFLCCLAAIVAGAMIALNLSSPRVRFTILIGGLAINLVSRMVKSIILKACLRTRPDGLLRAFQTLPTINVGMEDAKTSERIKLVIDDEGVCLLDAARQRILIEGCSYRYVIYARDIYSIKPVSRYAASGAVLKCRMPDSEFEVELQVRGHGPIASLIQTFSPSTGAAKLAATLTQTLFGSETGSYYQSVLPPPLPSS